MSIYVNSEYTNKLINSGLSNLGCHMLSCVPAASAKVTCISKASQKILINEYEFHREEPEIEFITLAGSQNKSITAVDFIEGLVLMRQNNNLEDK